MHKGDKKSAIGGWLILIRAILRRMSKEKCSHKTTILSVNEKMPQKVVDKLEACV